MAVGATWTGLSLRKQNPRNSTVPLKPPQKDRIRSGRTEFKNTFSGLERVKEKESMFSQNLNGKKSYTDTYTYGNTRPSVYIDPGFRKDDNGNRKTGSIKSYLIYSLCVCERIFSSK